VHINFLIKKVNINLNYFFNDSEIYSSLLLGNILPVSFLSNGTINARNIKIKEKIIALKIINITFSLKLTIYMISFYFFKLIIS